MTLPRPEHPRVDRFRPDWLNLNGTWQFKTDPGASGAEQNWQGKSAAFNKEILVPFCMESDLSGIGYKDFMPTEVRAGDDAGVMRHKFRAGKI